MSYDPEVIKRAADYLESESWYVEAEAVRDLLAEFEADGPLELTQADFIAAANGDEALADKISNALASDGPGITRKPGSPKMREIRVRIEKDRNAGSVTYSFPTDADIPEGTTIFTAFIPERG